jgi:hypothetical protein
MMPCSVVDVYRRFRGIFSILRAMIKSCARNRESKKNIFRFYIQAFLHKGREIKGLN